MKERPILFNALMVRALLDGSKTQMRWIAKFGKDYLSRKATCPYGQPGDRLWVKEGYIQGYPYDAVTDRLLQCDADGNDLPMKTYYRADKSDIGWSDDDGFQINVPWKPSISMPRTASRINLEIVGVRVERLQDISEADASAEGLLYSTSHIGHWSGTGDKWFITAQQAYAHLWESINGPGSWEANPWVWAVKFKRVMP